MSEIEQGPMKRELDLKETFTIYLRKWKWFALCVIVAVGLAYLQIRYTTPQFQAMSKIQILEDKNASSELGAFQDLDILSGGAKAKVEDEIELIKSRSNFIKIVKDLDLNIRLEQLGNIRNAEIYGKENYPFNLNFIASDSLVDNSKLSFLVEILSETNYGYALGEGEPVRTISFGKNLNTPIGNLVLTPNVKSLKNYKGRKYKVSITPVSSVAQSLQNRVTVSPSEEHSNIVNLSLVDADPQKAINVLNNLVDVYNQNYIEDKKAIADKTSEFIENRIADIYTNLSSVDESAERFKSNRGLTDIASQSNLNLNISEASRQELQDASIQLDIASSMKEVVDSQEGFEVLPFSSNIGLSDPGLTNSTARYNELVSERKRLLKSSNEKNPVIVNLDQELESLRQGMKSSLNSMTNNLNLQVNSLSKQLSQVNSRIYSAPSNERALRDITREQQTKESLYLYLLQKREESQITYASSNPKSKVVDYAYQQSTTPVSPKPMITYLASLIIGLLIPFSIIYANQLLDNKVHNKVSLERLVGNVPVLVEVPKLGKKEAKLVKKEDRSVLAESLRILRTNLNYIQRSKKAGSFNNLFFVTSSVPGEGKTFVSSNLAVIYANTGKKVLLIGADIRNPKLYNFFSNDDVVKDGKTQPRRSTRNGLTEYLVNSSLDIKDIVVPGQVNDNTIDIIFSGKIPPNPTELLMGDRVEELFKKVSEIYDYVIVDTAPLMVVTDTLLISEYAHQILYVVKAGVTELKVLDFPLKLIKEGKLKGLSFVVNNVKQSNLGYGGKYGYGYGKTVKKWWNFS